MEHCKHAPQEQAGFRTRLTDEALDGVMAPFPSWGRARKKGRDRNISTNHYF